MKKIIFFISLSCFQYLIYAKTPTESFKNIWSPAPADTINKIQTLISTRTEDTNKVMLLLRLSNIYMWSYPDSALLYSLQGLQLSQKLNFQKGRNPGLCIQWVKHYQRKGIIARPWKRS